MKSTVGKTMSCSEWQHFTQINSIFLAFTYFTTQRCDDSALTHGTKYLFLNMENESLRWWRTLMWPQHRASTGQLYTLFVTLSRLKCLILYFLSCNIYYFDRSLIHFSSRCIHLFCSKACGHYAILFIYLFQISKLFI